MATAIGDEVGRVEVASFVRTTGPEFDTGSPAVVKASVAGLVVN